MASPVTVITGTRKGIGKALAQHYLKLGHVVYGCSRSPIDWGGEGYVHVEADVAQESDVKALFRRVRKERGQVDNVINNAGIAAMNHALLTPSSTFETVMSTNALGTFLVAREGAKLMRSKSYGRIVNFSTVAVPLNLEGETAYAASKAAVESMTRTLARELAPFSVTVNAVGPTPIATDLIRGVPSDKIDALVRRQAISRLGTVEDVINLVDFFVRPESSFITGQTVYLGGV